MDMIERAANAWWAFFGTLAMALLICAALGMAFIENASTSPNEYPARFLVLAIAAMAVAMPGWIISIHRMNKP